MELETIVLGDASLGPRLLITAGVHGDEFEPMVAVRRLAAVLLKKRLRGEVELIPIVNVAAYRLGSRVADDGLDLARTCPGDVGGTITEQVAAALSKKIGHANFYVDLHTGGRDLRIAPLAGYMLHHDGRVLEDQRRLAEAFNLPTIWGTTPHLDGRSLSVARDAGVPAIYTEHGGGGDFCGDVVDDYLQGCLNVMWSLRMIEDVARPSRVVRRVEDARPDSGHLQIRHPAPLDGVFMPSVTIGQQVTQGDMLGSAIDPHQASSRPVTAECSGMVLMLRTSPRVKLGDALAVVLETGASQI